MKRLIIALSLLTLCAAAYAEETIPKTYDGAGGAFKDGGHELGDGFRGVGRGIKNTFTGKPSKEEYKKGKSIGSGLKDVGRGVAGGGRAVGHSVKGAVTGKGE